MKIRTNALLLNPIKTHCNPKLWAINPEKLEAREPNPKATKKKMPKAVPLISGGVYWARSVLFIGCRKKLKKKKARARMRSRKSVVKDIRKINGKAIMEMARNFFSR